MTPLTLLLPLLLLLPQHPAAPPPAPVALKPCDDCMPGVINFAKVDEALWRGSQPTAEGFKALEKAGVRTVVSLRHDHDDLELMKGTNLRYLRIPSRAWRGKEKDIVTFLKVMENKANWPVFIHCAQGRDRTGYNAAAYRIVVQGWKPEEALKEMKTFRFNRIWIGNPAFVRDMDPARLKPLVEKAAVPELRRVDEPR